MTKRVLPHHLEAEASVLGGILLRNESLAQLDTLEVDDFYDMRHRVVFAAMRNLEAAGIPIDVVTVDAAIEKQGKGDAVPVSFLGELAVRVPTASNVIFYADIVQSKRRARDLMLAAHEIFERGYEDDLDVEAYLSSAVAMVSRIDRAKPSRARTAGDMVRDRIRELEERAAAKERGESVFNGVPSGIASLDKDIGGYPLGDLSILAARPGMGKTAMAMSSIEAATAIGMGAHVFSAEGGWRMAADRMLSRASRVPVTRLRSADLRAEDGLGLAQAALRYMKRANWVHDDTPGLTAQEIIRRVRKERKHLGTKLVVVDYVQILKRTRGLDEHHALDEIVTAFAQAAIDDDIAYLVLSQLNRKVEERPDKRPVESDLRGSGALEERPRMIVSPYRGAKYYAEPKPGIDYECTCIASHMKGGSCACLPTEDAFARMVKVLVLKNSNGATGHYDATWDPELVAMQ